MSGGTDNTSPVASKITGCTGESLVMYRYFAALRLASLFFEHVLVLLICYLSRSVKGRDNDIHPQPQHNPPLDRNARQAFRGYSSGAGSSFVKTFVYYIGLIEWYNIYLVNSARRARNPCTPIRPVPMRCTLSHDLRPP